MMPSACHSGGFARRPPAAGLGWESFAGRVLGRFHGQRVLPGDVAIEVLAVDQREISSELPSPRR